MEQAVEKPQVIPTAVPTPLPTPMVTPQPTAVARPVVEASKPAVSTPSLRDNKQLLAAAGIPQSDWVYADYIISHEGHYCPTIWNGEHGCPAYHGWSKYKAYGACQALSPDKMASAGSDWTTNVVTQLRWCHSYALDRYGSWYKAYLYWISQKWW